MQPSVLAQIRQFLTATFICVVPTLCAGGADNITRYFMDNSPSLLDFGIHRLAQELNAVYDDRIHVSYDWEQDEIQISVLTFDTKGFSEADCREMIANIRSSAGYQDGELPDYYGGHSYFASLFTHNGYKVIGPDEDETRLQKLDKKFVVECRTRKKLIRAKLEGTQFAVTEFE